MKNQDNKTKKQVLEVAEIANEIYANPQWILAPYSSESFKLWASSFLGSISSLLTFPSHTSNS